MDSYLRKMSKDVRRQLQNLTGVGSVTSVAARIKMLYPEESQHYHMTVDANNILFKTKDDKLTIATYPTTQTGIIMLVYEFDTNVATALMYYATGGN